MTPKKITKVTPKFSVSAIRARLKEDAPKWMTDSKEAEAMLNVLVRHHWFKNITKGRDIMTKRNPKITRPKANCLAITAGLLELQKELLSLHELRDDLCRIHLGTVIHDDWIKVQFDALGRVLAEVTP